MNNNINEINQKILLTYPLRSRSTEEVKNALENVFSILGCYEISVKENEAKEIADLVAKNHHPLYCTERYSICGTFDEKPVLVNLDLNYASSSTGIHSIEVASIETAISLNEAAGILKKTANSTVYLHSDIFAHRAKSLLWLSGDQEPQKNVLVSETSNRILVCIPPMKKTFEFSHLPFHSNTSVWMLGKVTDISDREGFFSC